LRPLPNVRSGPSTFLFSSFSFLFSIPSRGKPFISVIYEPQAAPDRWKIDGGPGMCSSTRLRPPFLSKPACGHIAYHFGRVFCDSLSYSLPPQNEHTFSCGRLLRSEMLLSLGRYPSHSLCEQPPLLPFFPFLERLRAAGVRWTPPDRILVHDGCRDCIFIPPLDASACL